MNFKRTIIQWTLLVPVFLMNSTPLHFASAFTDIEPGDYHYLPIMELKEAGVVNGNPDGTYDSNARVTRAEALKLILLASGEHTEEDIEREFHNANIAPFPDTPLDAWYTKYVYYAQQKGYINGYDDGTFGPGDEVNLAEVLKMYLESRSNIIYPLLDGNLFEDVPADSWYADYFAYASTRGALDISLSNEAYPDRNVSRGYITDILYRMQKFGEGYEFGKATFYGAAVHGNGTASGETFDMYAYTAAHKTLPFGTIVEVTNLANGKSVQVEITDRGPYGAGRIIDLTSTAFEEIASLGAGVVNVQVKVVE